MKTPQFEELADQWGDAAEFFIVYSREAHAKARGNKRLNEFADKVENWDADRDGVVSREEFKGPDQGFKPFDIDGDDRLAMHEMLAARRINDFAEFDAPETYEQRLEAVRKYRAECPGDTEILVDGMDDAVGAAWGGRPNSAFVVMSKDGAPVITHAFDWANMRVLDAALRELVPADKHPAEQAVANVDWSPVEKNLAAAVESNRALLIEFTSPGCPACADMKAGALVAEPVVAALGGFERVTLGVEADEHWALFDALGLNGTPAFVVVRDRQVQRRHEGRASAEEMVAFLSAVPLAKAGKAGPG